MLRLFVESSVRTTLVRVVVCTTSTSPKSVVFLFVVYHRRVCCLLSGKIEQPFAKYQP